MRGLAVRRWWGSTRPGAELNWRGTSSTPTAPLLLTERTHLELLEGVGEVVPPDRFFVVDSPEWTDAIAPYAGAALPEVAVSPSDGSC